VDDFELEAVGVAAEDGVVAGGVVVLGGSVEDVGAQLEEDVVDSRTRSASPTRCR